MVLKPSQDELNIALKSLFCRLFGVHVIHDDIVVATVDKIQNVTILDKFVKILPESGTSTYLELMNSILSLVPTGR